jgi:segregation and condensation protein B
MAPSLGPAARRPWTRRPGNHWPHPLARLARQPPPAAATDPLARDAVLARVEAALFLADEPLTAKKLADVAGLPDAAAARRQADRLRAALDADGTAFQVAEVAGGFQLLTRPAFDPWLVRLRRPAADLRLTPTALETLAVVAYRQPVTRAEVDAVRGVATAEVIRLLMERGLVRTAGRHDSLGRPHLYATTKKFLQAFGLNSLADLPPADAP